MIRYAMLSKDGSRDHNEDSVGMWNHEDRFCFILADGLGGHGMGEVASKAAVDAVTASCKQGGEPDGAFMGAQEKIAEIQRERRECADMKTTLVVLWLDGKQVQWGHIGDSRLYYFQNGKIKTRTLDHSVPQMLVAIGEIREKQIRNHPDRNRLLKVLGVETEDVSYQLAEPILSESGQTFLLCSDGFWELIDEKKMEATLRRAKGPEEWLEEMEKIVLKNGKNRNMDNYSAVAVWTE